MKIMTIEEASAEAIKLVLETGCCITEALKHLGYTTEESQEPIYDGVLLKVLMDHDLFRKMQDVQAAVQDKPIN